MAAGRHGRILYGIPVAAILGIAVALAALRFCAPAAAPSAPSGCQGAPAGVRLNNPLDHECIGVSDGNYHFHRSSGKSTPEGARLVAQINEVEGRIAAENGATAKSPHYVRIVLLSPLTESRSITSTTDLRMILHLLQGTYTALFRANHSAEFHDSSVVKVQLLLANSGSQQEAGTEFVKQVTGVGDARHPLVAVVGLGSSTKTSPVLAQRLTESGIPLVSAVAAADNLTSIKDMWSVSPSSTQFVEALGGFLRAPGQKAVTSGLVVYDRNDDPFTTSVRDAYKTLFGDLLPFPEQAFTGSTNRAPIMSNAFRVPVQNICNAVQSRTTPLDTVFYAGRGADFEDFATYLAGRTCLKERPLTVIAVGTGFAKAEAYLDKLRRADIAVLYATSSYSAAWSGDARERPAYYRVFAQQFEKAGFTAADLLDGYAISHHDALATAVTALGLAASDDRPTPGALDVQGQFPNLSQANLVHGASGTLRFQDPGGRAIGRFVPLRLMGTTSRLPALPKDLPTYRTAAP